MNNLIHKVVRENNKMNVLVVDDDRSLRFHTRQVLEAFGLDVHEAESGEQALEAMKNDSFDTILLDVRMPGMDGFTACRELRRVTDGEFLPIIIVTGDDDPEALDKAFQSGATDFAIKPINWKKLKNRIRYLMNARRVAKDLASTENHRNALLDTIPDTILRMNMDGMILDVKSPHYGFDISKFLLKTGDCFHDVLPAKDAKQSRNAINVLRTDVATQQFNIEFEQSGESYFFEVRMVVVGGNEVYAMLRDFTARHRAEAEIRQLAYYDKVTGLPNRDLMCNEILKLVSEDVGMVSVTRLNMIGLEYAKSVLGRDLSDKLLGILAQRLLGVVEDVDIIDKSKPVVGRVSESGFVIVRNDFSQQSEIYDFALSLQQHTAEKFTLGGYEISLSAQVGTATTIYPVDDFDSSSLLEKAEIAMEQTCNIRSEEPLIYTAEMGQRTDNRARMSKELKIAVDNGDLHLDYQPKVDSDTRNLLGVEALLRWNSSYRGAISPADFIPLAESSGLILSIGEFVLYEACQQSRRWANAGERVVPIAVNFSGHQFNQRNLVKGILNTLNTYSVGNEHIEVELTESVALDNSDQVRSILGELKDLGIKTAIDDFGTGYSSLSSLSQFPFHTLKIDRSFVMDINRTSSGGSIVEGIINMGHALGMKVVAEGVEEEHQLDFLRKRKCDVIQGFLTGRPVSGDSIQSLLSC